MTDPQRELCFQASVSLTREEDQVLRLIRAAAGRPVRRPELVERTGESDRVVRRLVKRLVEVHKLPVVADYRGGYRWAGGDPEAKERCEKTYRRQGISVLVRAAALRQQALEEYLNQYPLRATELEAAG